MAEQHRHRVQGVVLRRKDRRLAPAIPIERGVQHRLGEISDRLPVGPHPLALEPAGDRVAPVRRLDIPHLRQLGIAEQDIPDDEGHLHLELQFRGLLRRLRLLKARFNQPVRHQQSRIRRRIGRRRVFLRLRFFCRKHSQALPVFLFLLHVYFKLCQRPCRNGKTQHHQNQR